MSTLAIFSGDELQFGAQDAVISHYCGRLGRFLALAALATIADGDGGHEGEGGGGGHHLVLDQLAPLTVPPRLDRVRGVAAAAAR